MPWRPLWSGPPILQRFSCLVRHFSFRWYSAQQQQIQLLIFLTFFSWLLSRLSALQYDSLLTNSPFRFYVLIVLIHPIGQLYSSCIDILSPLSGSLRYVLLAVSIFRYFRDTHMLHSWYSSPVFSRYTLARLYYGSAVSRAFIVSSYSPSRSHDHEQSILLFFLLFCALLYSEHPCSPILIAITTIIIK